MADKTLEEELNAIMAEFRTAIEGGRYTVQESFNHVIEKTKEVLKEYSDDIKNGSASLILASSLSHDKKDYVETSCRFAMLIALKAEGLDVSHGVEYRADQIEQIRDKSGDMLTELYPNIGKKKADDDYVPRPTPEALMVILCDKMGIPVVALDVAQQDSYRENVKDDGMAQRDVGMGGVMLGFAEESEKGQVLLCSVGGRHFYKTMRTSLEGADMLEDLEKHAANSDLLFVNKWLFEKPITHEDTVNNCTVIAMFNESEHENLVLAAEEVIAAYDPAMKLQHEIFDKNMGKGEPMAEFMRTINTWEHGSVFLNAESGTSEIKSELQAYVDGMVALGRAYLAKEGAAMERNVGAEKGTGRY